MVPAYRWKIDNAEQHALFRTRGTAVVKPR
jgi:hypothetical protein